MSIEARVKERLMNRLNVTEDKLSNDAHIVRDLGADSLDTVELAMDFEEEFSVQIPDEDVEKLSTVGSAIKYFEDKLGTK
jgi:acyl carrier protein